MEYITMTPLPVYIYIRLKKYYQCMYSYNVNNEYYNPEMNERRAYFYQSQK